MIKLKKGDKPQVLIDNADYWTTELVKAYENGGKPTDTQATRYRAEEIKLAIINETHGKCAYCETKVIHSQPGDIEHIFPKSLDRKKTFEWDNLTLACRTCNTNKSNKDPYLNHIIDPYKADPIEHLTFLGPFIYSKGTNRGTSTRTLLELHRAELAEDRQAVLDRHMLVYQQVANEGLPLVTRKAIYEEFVANVTSPSAEYSAMNKAMVLALADLAPMDEG